jgi:mono/diheme cytochrome c family protein
MKFFFIGYLVITTITSLLVFQDNSLEKSIERGGDIYAGFCVNCHLAKGEGVKNTIPPLVASDYLIKFREESIRGVKYGQRGKIVVNGVTYNGVMPPMGLSDDEVADVMNYVLNSWGNKSKKMVTLSEVIQLKKLK